MQGSRGIRGRQTKVCTVIIRKFVGFELKRKPDLMLVLLAVFGLGVVITLIAPMSSTRSVAEPASPLQAGVITQDED